MPIFIWKIQTEPTEKEIIDLTSSTKRKTIIA